jgi:alkanesulfonate monooxygenase SsuD/methylene tetrahydromethanopterin reductase-like flavin-dependent oxidoreductase (luciferase family)
MIKRILAAAIITLATVASAAALTGDAKAAIQQLLNSVVSSQTALTTSVKAAIIAADTTEEAAAILAQYGRPVTKAYLDAFAANPGNDGALAAVILQAMGVKSIGGKPVTPELALAVLAEAGINVNGSPAAIAAQVLNNPITRNAVLEASKNPITPMTPRT